MDILFGLFLGWLVGSWASYIYCWCLYTDEGDGFNIREFILIPLTIISLIIKEIYGFIKKVVDNYKK